MPFQLLYMHLDLSYFSHYPISEKAVQTVDKHGGNLMHHPHM